MSRFTVVLKGVVNNTPEGKTEFLNAFAKAYKLTPEKARSFINEKKGRLYTFADKPSADKAKSFLESLGGQAEILDSYVHGPQAPAVKASGPPPVQTDESLWARGAAQYDNMPQKETMPIRSAGPHEELELAPRPAAPAPPAPAYPAGAGVYGGQPADTGAMNFLTPVRAVFRSLGGVKFPRRCVWCNEENPEEQVYMNTMQATRLTTGMGVGMIGGGLVGGLVGSIVGGAMAARRGEVAFYMLPMCSSCKMKLATDDEKMLGGKKDHKLMGTLEVNTPFLKREIAKKCVIMTFYNTEYGKLFREMNENYVFDTIDQCRAAPIPKAELPDDFGELEIGEGCPLDIDLPAFIVSLLGDGSLPPLEPGSRDFESRILNMLRTLQADYTGVFTTFKMPEKKLKNAATACSIPENERVLGLIDCTVMGSAKNAMVLARSGLYYNNSGSANQPGPGYVPYQDFALQEFKKSDELNISLGNDRFLEPGAASLGEDRTLGLLEAIKLLIEGYDPEKMQTEGARPKAPAEAGGGDGAQSPAAVASEGTPPTVGQAVTRAVQRWGKNEGLYKKPDIPDKKIKNARDKCQVPANETVFALLDLTTMGSAKNALLFGEKGLYVNNDWTATISGNAFMPYSRLTQLPVESGKFKEINIGPDFVINFAGCMMKKDNILTMLHNLQKLLRGN